MSFDRRLRPHPSDKYPNETFKKDLGTQPKCFHIREDLSRALKWHRATHHEVDPPLLIRRYWKLLGTHELN